MKVVRGGVASISLALALSTTARPAQAAEEATCAGEYLSCVNEASQEEGFWARTWAEQKCNSAWYSCVRRQAFGA